MITAATLIGLAWKSALVAGLTLLLLRLVRSRSAGERSLIAHAGLAALLALPLATLLLPQWQPLPADWAIAEPAPAAASTTKITGGSAVDPASSATASVPVVEDPAGSPSITLPSFADLAPGLYALPLALLAGLMGIAVLRLFAMRGRADVLVESSWLSALAEAQRRMGFKHGTALLVSDELRSPISWGVLRPTIVLSPKAVAAVGEAEAIIAHELAHVARLDWAKLLAARLACALFWFNPLVWMLARESHQLREEAADDAVLMADIDGPDYATLLVGAARHDNKATLIAAHGVAPAKGSLKRRITRVLDGSLKRGPASAGWILMSLVVLAGITAPLAAFSATAETKVADETHAMAFVAQQSAIRSMQSAMTAKDLTDVETRDVDTGAAPAAEPLRADDLVGMRAVGVTPEYVEKLREHGGSMDPDDIIAAKATGVDPAYIGSMRAILPGADFGDLVGAKQVGIDAAFARDMKEHFPGVDLDDLIALKAMGVDCDFVTDMRKAGVRLRDPDDAIELRATGMHPRGRGAKRSIVSKDGATVRFGPGPVIEARSADGRVARIEVPEAPAATRPPVPPAPPGT
ncbi:M56 family metallopeptidase [Sphingopyxis macrogoltabida]|uniref:Peptidase M56 domain-containing protein n=1 Tax=Sphingopyxis macrogoltabida TaxID=33050 RepID=A0AAC8YX79_SPHMC|nr:M56 family metallopeptidase [Sphingopyxis macrogoltabida]ALJ11415.1 hypothetical protein LH19_00930 [Sphingopyxis macrogoltabida]AMU87609.1 hypothetical protein ATM17_00925 [Sphingopyxis macrogoltabida]